MCRCGPGAALLDEVRHRRHARAHLGAPNPTPHPDPHPDPHPNPHPHPHPNQLTIDGGEPFYEVDSSFGWFIPEVFEKQIGLDNGKTTPAWHLLPKNAGPQPQVYALP